VTLTCPRFTGYTRQTGDAVRLRRKTEVKPLSRVEIATVLISQLLYGIFLGIVLVYALGR
jgi:hypothetical protein